MNREREGRVEGWGGEEEEAWRERGKGMGDRQMKVRS